MPLALLLTLLTLLKASSDGEDVHCDPADSKPDPRILLADGANGSCYFPFAHSLSLYRDCKPMVREGMLRFWCATTCNSRANRNQLAVCKYTLQDLRQPNCSALPNAKPSRLPPLFGGKGSGTQCIFPFLYNNICHYDCIKGRSPKPWCPTTTEQAVSVMAYNMRYCVYTFAGLRSESCTRINEASPHSLVPYRPGARASAQTDPDGNCMFPFYFDGRCYDDCTTAGGKEWHEIWCSTEKFYEPRRRWRFCPHYRSYRNVTNLRLRWGFYRVLFSPYGGCEAGEFCSAGGVVAAADDVPLSLELNRRLALSEQSPQIWEILPQPNGFFLIRSAAACGSVPLAWSQDHTQATAPSVATDRQFWRIVPASRSSPSSEQTYRILSTRDKMTRLSLKPQRFRGHPVLLLRPESRETGAWSFEEIRNSEKVLLKVCEGPPVRGQWCPWTSFVPKAELWFHRRRNCSCPAPANGGVGCVGSATDSYQVVHGSWCAWNSFVRDVGTWVRRQRSCACPAPANGGRRCPGDSEERRQSADGQWCPWGGFVRLPASKVRLATRRRACSCPEPVLGGATCEGAANQTGPVVDGNWCRWSPLLRNRRTRNCTCPAPAFGGSACAGPSEETGPLVHGEWCPWTGFSPSADGWESRSRECECPAPARGGRRCLGDDVESRPAEVPSVSVGLTTVLIIAGVAVGLFIICVAVVATRRKGGGGDGDGDDDGEDDEDDYMQ